MGHPLVHAVIPLIDNLTNKLTAFAESTSLHVAVRAGAVAGYKVLNKYYSKTDESIVYRLAICKLIFLLNSIDLHVLSATSKIQAGLLPQEQVGEGVDRCGPADCPLPL